MFHCSVRSLFDAAEQQGNEMQRWKRQQGKRKAREVNGEIKKIT